MHGKPDLAGVENSAKGKESSERCQWHKETEEHLGYETAKLKAQEISLQAETIPGYQKMGNIRRGLWVSRLHLAGASRSGVAGWRCRRDSQQKTKNDLTRPRYAAIRCPVAGQPASKSSGRDVVDGKGPCDRDGGGRIQRPCFRLASGWFEDVDGVQRQRLVNGEPRR